MNIDMATYSSTFFYELLPSHFPVFQKPLNPFDAHNNVNRIGERLLLNTRFPFCFKVTAALPIAFFQCSTAVFIKITNLF